MRNVNNVRLYVIIRQSHMQPPGELCAWCREGCTDREADDQRGARITGDYDDDPTDGKADKTLVARPAVEVRVFLDAGPSLPEIFQAIENDFRPLGPSVHCASP